MPAAWYPPWTPELQVLLARFAAWSSRHQGSVIAYLIEENRVLKEQLESGGRRLRFTDDQRRRLAAKGKPLGRKAARRSATIATPERPMRWATFIRAHAHLIAAADFFITEVWTVRG